MLHFSIPLFNARDSDHTQHLLVTLKSPLTAYVHITHTLYVAYALGHTACDVTLNALKLFIETSDLECI